MRRSMKIGIPALALAAASLAVGACAGGRSAGGEGTTAVRAGTAAEPPAAAAPRAEVGAAVGPSRGAVETTPAAGGMLGGNGVLQMQRTPDVAALEDMPRQRVIQTATLSLTVARGDFDDAFNRARSIALGLGGFVTGSSTSQGPDERLVRGELVLRVPQQAYAEAITQLSRLGRVESQQETGKDVSQQYVDLAARQRHLEAVEAQLLGFLKRTTTVSEALAVQSRLDDVQLGLEEVRGQLRYLDGATAYSTITVDIAERGAPIATKPKPAGGWSLADAWHAAASGFEKVVGGALVALVVAGPILVLLALLVLGGRAIARRRAARAGQPGGPAASPSS
jgi:hypothetical protein